MQLVDIVQAYSTGRKFLVSNEKKANEDKAPPANDNESDEEG